MSFRIVIITKRSILSYKDNYLVIRSDENEMIHLSRNTYLNCSINNGNIN